jgi:hypothetical protein
VHKIILSGADEWHAFFEDNREVLLELYPCEQDALADACDRGLTLGGGAAPLFHVTIAEAE